MRAFLKVFRFHDMRFRGQSPTAIIIDDDEAIIKVFRVILHAVGVAVLASGYDGKAAVRLYEKYSPDFVFTDIMMPENDGFYALEKIRKLDRYAKVVAVTADLTDETAKRLKELNISAVIYKPFSIEDIEKVLIENYEIKTS